MVANNKKTQKYIYWKQWPVLRCWQIIQEPTACCMHATLFNGYSIFFKSFVLINQRMPRKYLLEKYFFSLSSRKRDHSVTWKIMFCILNCKLTNQFYINKIRVMICFCVYRRWTYLAQDFNLNLIYHESMKFSPRLKHIQNTEVVSYGGWNGVHVRA